MSVASSLRAVLGPPETWAVYICLLVCVSLIIVLTSGHYKFDKVPKLRGVHDVAKFCYSCFIKPLVGGSYENQQDALEGFYKAQASIYDSTRSRLLQGREDMLGLVAAQMKHRIDAGVIERKPIWVDIGGGTGWNIENMAQFVDVPSFFSAVYLVDLSPSLCAVAEDRFARLGWKNVHVMCKDARQFRLEDDGPGGTKLSKKLDLVTMSYSLSMIPDYYSVVDAISQMLSPKGILGAIDFYVQSEIDYRTRNYIGGEINRHCMWISRVFWRTWFEADRVSLEAARRDYLEYKFGTVLSFNARCQLLGFRIPYYVFIGTSAKEGGASRQKLVEINAAVTESPYLAAIDHQSKAVNNAQDQSMIEIRSKAYESAIVNLASSLPLPASWYQAHHWRVYYDDTLQKHRQFKDEYIYAFTWEDSRVDARLLKIQEDDVILAITSAGDNILSYASENPKRIHAVDLNPSQNHLLELKVAAYTVLPYADFWMLFGEGKHPKFRELLVTKLSPHLSSLAFQYWLHHGPKTFSSKGLYYTGGSRHAIVLVQWLFGMLGLSKEISHLCNAQTLNEQREIWQRSVRRVLLSRIISWTIISNKKWLWKALGVPDNQREMIEQDFKKQDSHVEVATSSLSDDGARDVERIKSSLNNVRAYGSGQAIYAYAINTFDPVVQNSLLSNDNHYYLISLLGRYTQKCHPTFLTPRTHAKLSRPGAFGGLRIHTDSISDVVERMAPQTLSIAVLMDSMDWFDPTTTDAESQIAKVARALKPGGRVLLRSSGLEPWYIKRFEAAGFVAKRVGARFPGSCIDRVNMYASTWICTKGSGEGPAQHSRGASLEELDIGEATIQD